LSSYHNPSMIAPVCGLICRKAKRRGEHPECLAVCA
jgi:hypothetical protein